MDGKNKEAYQRLEELDNGKLLKPTYAPADEGAAPARAARAAHADRTITNALRKDNGMKTVLPVILIGIAVVAYIAIIKRTRPHRHLRNTRKRESMPLQCSPEAFRERFSQSVAPPANGGNMFEGSIFRDGHFFFTFENYYVPGVRPGMRMTIAGILEENAAYYKISGHSSRPAFERERLLSKLRELCAPEPGAPPEEA